MRLVALLLVGLLAIVATPSAAQDLATQRESIRAMHGYGYCVVQEERVRARRVLSFPPGSSQERDLLRAISTDQCLSGQGQISQIAFSPQLLRGFIAEALYDGFNARQVSARPGAAAAPFTGLGAADIAALDERGRAALRALDFAQCIVQAAPDDVRRLIGTMPASPLEDRAFARLAPHFSPCLPQGAQMEIVKPQLRGFLAEAAYRAAYASAQRPPQPGR